MSRVSFTVRRSIVSIAALALSVVMLLPSVAQAQFGQAAGIARLIRPEYTRADVRIVVEALELDDMQRLIVESLFEDYQLEFETGFDDMRERLSNTHEKTEGADPEEVMEIVFAPLEQWRYDRDDLGEELMENIRLILNEQQLSTWDNFRRRLIREKSMADAEFSGEGVNLFKVLDEMRLAEDVRKAIDETVTQYDMALDEALKHRNGIIEESASMMLISLQMQDADKMLDIISRLNASRIFVRNLNDQYREEIAMAMPDDLTDEFRRRALLRGYDIVYRRPAVERMFEEAFELDLDDETRQTLEDMYMLFHELLAAENTHLMAVIRDHEPKASMNRAEVYCARMTKEDVQKIINPIPGTMRKRDGLYETYTERLKELLGDETFLTLTGAERWVAKRERAEERAAAEEARRNAREIEQRERERRARTSEDGNLMTNSSSKNKGKRGSSGSSGGGDN